MSEEKKIWFWVGIDNGVSGSIGVVSSDGNYSLCGTPVFNVQDYTKKKKRINRVDTKKLEDLLSVLGKNVTVILERPLVNPGRFMATISGVRAFEATLIVVERLGLRYIYADSKEWQKELLPAGYEDTKVASADVSTRLFPREDVVTYIRKHKDGDAILMAEWAKRHNL